MTLRCMFAQMYVTPPAGGAVVIPGAFDAGARFDGGGQPTIPVSFFIFKFSVGYLFTWAVLQPYTQAAVVKMCGTVLLDTCAHKLCPGQIHRQLL